MGIHIACQNQSRFPVKNSCNVQTDLLTTIDTSGNHKSLLAFLFYGETLGKKFQVPNVCMGKLVTNYTDYLYD